MLSAIQVIRHGFRSFKVESHDDFSDDAKFVSTYDVTASQHHGEVEGDENYWDVHLLYQFGAREGEQGRYSGRIEAQGLFWIQPNFAEEKKENLAHMNGGAILLGAVREAVLNLTIRSINGPLELPLVDARSFLPEEVRSQNFIPAPKPKPEGE